jgi:leucyl-tRNA synthetase
MKKYNPAKVEKKWQEYWAANNSFATSDGSGKPKKYVLMEFPYPSGDGLHMGHVRGYTAADVVARYYRMAGHEVMYPIGWDAFGLPAENYAIKHGKDPKTTTEQNIAKIKKQFQGIGYSFDWDREINTTDPKYYKWTQWLFLQFYKAGLAYEATGLINWCPKDLTGLANEEVINGACERCGTKVEKKELRQWYLKITEYAEKLLAGLKDLPQWPEAVKLQQENWIGLKEGAIINHAVEGLEVNLETFTAFPSWIFADTFIVLAPEHPLVTTLSSGTEQESAVSDFVSRHQALSEEQRAEGKEGVFTGRFAIDPLTGTKMPIWIANFAMMNFGTGAIRCSAHDPRDYEFAQKYKIPLKEVAARVHEDAPVNAHDNAGVLIGSGEFTGKEISEQLSSEIIVWLERKNFGQAYTTYRLRDWVFSRQRYWGEPIPLVHCEKDGVVAVPDDQLPVLLPAVKKYEPTGTGESPLAAVAEWVNTTCPQCGGRAKRETNTMPQWAGSSWYYLRYIDPQNPTAFADQEKLKHWLPVDLYFGGMEHTTLHLLYSRFWNIFLHDQGLVPVSEPYIRRIPHGTILAEDGSKMSKSKGNVVNPDELVKQHGADTVRMYELFLGPHEASVSWSDKGIIGVARFLDRVWYWVHNAQKTEQDSEQVQQALHKAIKAVTEDIEGFRFNTVVSTLMSLHNGIKDQPVTTQAMQTFAQLLNPVAPHIAEEIHEIITGRPGDLQSMPWPKYDASLLQNETLNVVVQINGKTKETLSVTQGAGEEEVKQLALQSERVQTTLGGKEIKRTVFVQDRLINFVV